MCAIAAELPKPKHKPEPVILRADQVALMYLHATSPSKINLAQLPTGAGKSLMFGLLARYYNN